jgi:hypothetical protein
VSDRPGLAIMSLDPQHRRAARSILSRLRVAEFALDGGGQFSKATDLHEEHRAGVDQPVHRHPPPTS